MAAPSNIPPFIKTQRFHSQCHTTPSSPSSCSLPFPTGAPVLRRGVRSSASRSTTSLPCGYPLRFREQMPKSPPSRRGFVTVNSLAATEEKSVAGDRMLVFVPPHPLIKHWVSVLRNEQTPPPIFRSALAELGRLLIYEASRDCLPTVTGEIQSPMGVATVEFIDPREPVAVIPILRAGLALSEHASSILPATKTYHLGLSRDEETLLPTIYLNKLPKRFPDMSRIFVIDPMLATGGTMVAALDLIKERGVENRQIKVISAVAAPPALQKLSEKFPGLQVYTGIIDPIVNDKGFIVPGLGDAGDRSYGT